MPTLEQRALYTQELKQCSTCEEVLPFAAFNMREQDGKLYCHSRCKNCEHQSYLDKKDLIREQRRQRSLGVPLGTYNFLIAEYGAQCSICGAKNPGGTSRESGQFHIDHDHKTGRVRGLLCGTCNVGIGMLKHDSKLLLQAIQYLARAGHSVEELEKFLGSSDLSAEELGL